MHKIRTLIVDDEPPARKLMRHLLSQYPDFVVIGECSNGEQALRIIKKEEPEVVFLDVQMPGLDGFGVLENLKTEALPIVIFVTAYDKYAIRAFEASAIDYVLKPYDHQRLDKAITRVRQNIGRKERTGGKNSTATLIGDTSDTIFSTQRILVRRGGKILVVRVEEIDCIEAAGDYVRLRVGGQEYLLREKLGVLEKKLEQDKFVRIHRSFIANIDRIKEMEPVFHGDYRVVLIDGKKLGLSRTYVSKLFNALRT